VLPPLNVLLALDDMMGSYLLLPFATSSFSSSPAGASAIR
jgi:hypothetical protein